MVKRVHNRAAASEVGDFAQTLLGGDGIIPESCFADTKTDVKSDRATDVAA
jgi:hypothetical protein